MSFTSPLCCLLLTAPALAQTTFDDEVKVQPPLPHTDPDLKTEIWTPPHKEGSTPSDNAHLSGSERAALDRSFDHTRSPASQDVGLDKATPEDTLSPEQLLALPRPAWQEHFQLDEPGDGNLWAFGGTYKARFNAVGARYIPFLGSTAPRNFPLDIQLASITLGGEPLAFDGEVDPTFEGHAAVFARGSVEERYELRVGELEQLFVFDSLPGTGELIVRMDVVSELVGRESADGLAFEGVHGAVEYGFATVLDAGGRSAPAPTRLVEGGIEIRVPADFVAAASLPLTIDPVVSTFSVNIDASDDTAPDVAYDIDTDRFCLCWQRPFSSNDRDVWTELRGSTGALVASSGVYVDFTSADWTNPQIANNRIASQFLVVAEDGVYPTTDISGRTREAESNAIGSQFVISSGTGDKRNPDVGGDPHTTGPTYYCVVWERAFDIAVDHDIHARLVRSTSTLLGTSAILIDNSAATYDKYPSVSPSNGIPSAATQEWNIVWQRQFSSSDWDIRGAQVHWSGSLTSPSFSVDFSGRDDWYPEASSPLDYQGDGARVWMAVYRRDDVTDFDIEATVWKGTQYINDSTLSDLTISAGQDQFEPTIDSNGLHFAVAWNEYYSTSTVDRDVYVGSFYVSGDDIHASEARVNLAFSIDPEFQVQCCARRSGGLQSDWIMLVWRDGDIGDGDIEGAVYELPDFYGSSIGTNYCGPAALNSSGQSATMHATGSAMAGGEPVNLSAFGLPLNQFAQFMGTPGSGGYVQPPGSQGFFCLSIPYGRFNEVSQIMFSGTEGRVDLDVDTTDMPMNPHVAVMAGETWRFQAWFRDQNPGNTSNFTDAIAITFH